jgi:hypothetical protein
LKPNALKPHIGTIETGKGQMEIIDWDDKDLEFFEYVQEQLYELPEDATPQSEATLFWLRTDHAYQTAKAFEIHMVDRNLNHPIPDKWWRIAQFFAAMHIMDKTPLPDPTILTRSIVDACDTEPKNY